MSSKRFIILLFCTVLFLVFIVGCGKNYSMNKKIQEETEDLQNRVSEGSVFLTKPSDNYNIFARVTLKKEETDKIIYEITVDQPKVMMKNVSISAMLNQDMNVKLKTDNVFFTNILDIDSIPQHE